MSPIPLVRARYASGFVTALLAHGAPAARYLERAGLPEELLENSDGLISAFSLWAFAGNAARDTGIRDLGVAAGSLSELESHIDLAARVCFVEVEEALRVRESVRTLRKAIYRFRSSLLTPDQAGRRPGPKPSADS